MAAHPKRDKVVKPFPVCWRSLSPIPDTPADILVGVPFHYNTRTLLGQRGFPPVYRLYQNTSVILAVPYQVLQIRLLNLACCDEVPSKNVPENPGEQQRVWQY